ncbi:MAG: amidoligase family protein [Deltaproteobacteria bacterium]|nr:amidoligase family protein [Deltaproteobacteria bacterium]
MHEVRARIAPAARLPASRLALPAELEVQPAGDGGDSGRLLLPKREPGGRHLVPLSGLTRWKATAPLYALPRSTPAPLSLPSEMKSCARLAYTAVASAIAATVTDPTLRARMPLHDPRSWLALILLHDKAPRGVVEHLCCDHEAVPPQGNLGLMSAYYELARGTDATHDAIRVVSALGIARFMSLVPDIRPKGRETGKAAALADATLEGIRYMQDFINTYSQGARVAGQKIGGEIEFTATRDRPTGDVMLVRTDSRDQVSALIGTHLSEHGATYVADSAPRFHLDLDPRSHLFTTVIERYEYGSQQAVVARLQGSGGVIIPTWDAIHDACERFLADAPATAGDKAVFSETVKAQARKKAAGILGLSEAELAAHLAAGTVQHEEIYIILPKAVDGDLAKLAVVIDRAKGEATVAGMNARFVERGKLVPTRTYPATTIEEVHAAIRAEISKDQEFLAKSNTIVGITVPGHFDPDSLVMRVVDDSHPLSELVTPPATHKDFPIIQKALRALAQAGYHGTTPHWTGGVHVHYNVPLKGKDGRYSIAPMIAALREFLTHQRILMAAIRPDRRRVGYVHPFTHNYAKRVTAPGYVIDPEDPEQILCAMADNVASTKEKYSALNSDNLISALGRAMLEAGAFDGVFQGQPLATVSFNGRRYEFEMRKDADGPQIFFRYDRTPWRPLFRMPKRYHKRTTIEWRLFDTPNRRLPNGRHAIAVDAIMWYLKFVTAWAHRMNTPVREAASR